MINQTSQTLYRLDNLNAEQTRISYQMATGKKIDNGSDDASLYSREILVDDRIRTYEGIKYQIERTTAQNNASDSTIGEMKKLFELVKTELIKANTATTSDEGRKAIALNVAGIKENLLDLANTQIEGEYLFAGSDSSVIPFVEDASGQVTFNGDNGYRKIAVDDGSYRLRGVNGYDVMTYPSSTANKNETLSFTADDVIIDQDGSIWALNGTNTEIQKLNNDGSVDTSVVGKTVVITADGYDVDVGSLDGTEFEARSSIFDLLDKITNTLNKKDSDGNPISSDVASDLLGKTQEAFSNSYDALNQAMLQHHDYLLDNKCQIEENNILRVFKNIFMT